MAKYFSVVQDIPAVSIQDYCGGSSVITQTALDKILCAFVMKSETGGNTAMPITAWYKGSGNITIADYNAFPVGSIIWDYTSATKAVYFKVAASTWVSETLT